MMGIHWAELFPTRKSIFIFLMYMSLFVAQGKILHLQIYLGQSLIAINDDHRFLF